MWSKDSNEPRIAAGVKRHGTYTVWLKKFATLDESIKHYYITIGRVKDYREFRILRYKTDDVNQLVKKLDKYSELGDEYTKIISDVIRHNNLTKYDE
jgi:Bax protein